MPLLLLLFLVVPLVELYVLIQVGQEIGALNTIALLVVVSVAGAWLAKREGVGVWVRMQQQVSSGRVPGLELIDAFLILIPPTRALVRGVVRRWLVGRVDVVSAVGGSGGRRPDDIDV